MLGLDLNDTSKKNPWDGDAKYWHLDRQMR